MCLCDSYLSPYKCSLCLSQQIQMYERILPFIVGRYYALCVLVVIVSHVRERQTSLLYVFSGFACFAVVVLD